MSRRPARHRRARRRARAASSPRAAGVPPASRTRPARRRTAVPPSRRRRPRPAHPPRLRADAPSDHVRPPGPAARRRSRPMSRFLLASSLVLVAALASACCKDGKCIKDPPCRACENPCCLSPIQKTALEAGDARAPYGAGRLHVRREDLHSLHARRGSEDFEKDPGAFDEKGGVAPHPEGQDVPRRREPRSTTWTCRSTSRWRDRSPPRRRPEESSAGPTAPGAPAGAVGRPVRRREAGATSTRVPRSLRFGAPLREGGGSGRRRPDPRSGGKNRVATDDRGRGGRGRKLSASLQSLEGARARFRAHSKTQGIAEGAQPCDEVLSEDLEDDRFRLGGPRRRRLSRPGADADIDPQSPPTRRRRRVGRPVQRRLGHDEQPDDVLERGLQDVYPNVNPAIEGKGSSTAPPALIEGTATSAHVARDEGRGDRRSSRRSSATSRRASACLDALAVFVHKDNPSSA